MSLPGLSLSEPTEEAPEDTPPRTITLQAGSEWRFEVAFSSNITIKLLPGPPSDVPTAFAEIFGTELVPNRPYTFPGGTKKAVYTWHGCTLEVTGRTDSEYESDETPMNEYINLHFALENMRAHAANTNGDGPKVLVVGSEDAGKTALIKTLVAYATKMGRSPMTINLDPSEGMLSLPGSLSLCVHGSGSLLDIEDECGGWGSSPISGPTAVPVKMPLVYQYGLESPEDSPAIFKPLTTAMAVAATNRSEEDEEVKSAGYFIDTPGSISQTKGGAELIQHIVAEFSVNVVLVVGAERTYSDLQRRFSNPPAGTEAVTVLKLSRSGGAVRRDKTYTRQMQRAQIRNYFYGSRGERLDPTSRTVDFSELAVFRLVDPEDSNAQFLPGGETELSSASDLYERITAPTHAMTRGLLAISYMDPTRPHDDIRDCEIQGYLYVADIEEAKKKVRILAPIGGAMPNTALVWATWPEGVGDLAS